MDEKSRDLNNKTFNAIKIPATVTNNNNIKKEDCLLMEYRTM